MPRKLPPKTSPKPKRGRLSRQEIAFILSKSTTLSVEAIAKKLSRPTDQVQRELDRATGMKPEARMTYEMQLESRPEWCQFQKQFTRDELAEFKHQYVQMVSTQFKDDLMPTEELQLFQVITLKILIDRTLTEQKMALEDMQSAHKIIEDLHGHATTDEDKVKLLSAAESYEAAKRTNRECAERYKIYSDKQDKLFASLKATRDQRVKYFENSNHSILGWLRFLMEEENRRMVGDEGEMMRLAAQKEKERLSQLHRYEDGTEDQPLLTPENVLE